MNNVEKIEWWSKYSSLHGVNDQQWCFTYPEFYDFISSKSFKVLVEVGVYNGHSISYLAQKNKSSKIWAVDLFDLGYIDTYKTNLENAGVRDIITDIRGLSWDGALHFNDNSIDFCFIDADHTYESVTKDIQSWFPKVKIGGIISGHDYDQNNIEGVVRSVTKFFKDVNLQVKIFKGSVWYVIK